jgi:hypothetical protein
MWSVSRRNAALSVYCPGNNDNGLHGNVAVQRMPRPGGQKSPDQTRYPQIFMPNSLRSRVHRWMSTVALSKTSRLSLWRTVTTEGSLNNANFE